MSQVVGSSKEQNVRFSVCNGSEPALEVSQAYFVHFWYVNEEKLNNKYTINNHVVLKQNHRNGFWEIKPDRWMCSRSE